MTSHQTVRLDRGAHRSPEHGVCVMELASMLAGEHFSDKPRSVSPVIAAFLRSYNDSVDDERRQGLYAYAALSVGTRAPAAVDRARSRRCRRWVEERGGRVPLRVLIGGPGSATAAFAGRWAAERGALDAHTEAIALVEELIAMGCAGDGRTALTAGELAGMDVPWPILRPRAQDRPRSPQPG